MSITIQDLQGAPICPKCGFATRLQASSLKDFITCRKSKYSFVCTYCKISAPPASTPLKACKSFEEYSKQYKLQQAESPPNCGSGVNPPTFHIDGREVMRHAGIKPSDNATTAGLRPCYVGARKALFHKWEKKQTASPLGGMLEFTVALVEFENGSIETRNPQHIRFADSAGLFKQFDFDEKSEAKT